MFNKIVTSALSSLLLSTAAAAVPETFLYVGELEQNGAPADGAFSVTFQMFDDATAGAVVYSEAVASLDVVDGALVYELGSSPSNPLDDAELAAGELYLSVIVNGTALEPRVPIRSVPFAATATHAESASLLAGTSLTSITDGTALLDGALQTRHIASPVTLYQNDIGCGDGIFITLNAFCIAPTDGCPSGQQHPCNSIFSNTNCAPITAGSRNCPNQAIGTIFPPQP